MTRCALFSFLLIPCLLATNPCCAVEKVDYEREIKPILARKCVLCHGPLKQRSKLRVDTAAALLKGGRSGPAVVPGDAKESLLVGVLTGDAGFRMPPSGKPLELDEVALIQRWIREGATAPKDEIATSDWRKHWAFRPVERPAVPDVNQKEWVRNPIDAFIASQHEKEHLTPSKSADPSLLLRRLYLDLIGVPPTREQIREYLLDASPDAYERAVGRLLDSPQYGERWARHWMDVWRYSDWYGRRNSNEIRYSQYHIWRWRDWIVDSLNDDKGYDRMIQEMLAGDELDPANPDVLRATGFLGRNWYKFDRDVWLRETVEHTAMGFLSLTLKCARCHDHKYDPISQADYYRFRAFFEPHEVRLDPIASEADPMKVGLARVFDAHPKTPTYLFIRGDDRYPDKENPLAPGVPPALGEERLAIAPVELPVEAWYPSLRPEIVEQRLRCATNAVKVADAKLRSSEDELVQAKARVEKGEIPTKVEPQPLAEGSVFLEESFDELRPDVWDTVHGTWTCDQGSVRQSQITNWAMIQTRQRHPTNFEARIRYRTTGGGIYNSVGVAFDGVELRDFQAVYTSISKGKSSVQAFHRKDKKEVYPPAGIVPHPLKMNEEILLELAVRDQLLNVRVNGELKLVYRLPMDRQSGQFALWNHSGTAEFLDVRIAELHPKRKLAQSLSNGESTLVPKTKADWERRAETLIQRIVGERLALQVAEAEMRSYQARVEAERAKFASPKGDKLPPLAQRAAKAERAFAFHKAEHAHWLAESNLAKLRAVPKPQTAAIEKAEKQVQLAKTALSKAKSALASTKSAYSPLGKTHPKTSTGRRLALAQWIVNENNPRTARVAVNHIWRWHFGVPLVESVANFGLAGKPPSHPELLDWLAIELIENGWKMKYLHRLIVTSQTYRLASSTRDQSHPNVQRDPQNRFLWRMNWKRMEAEVVRDSILHLAGTLDRTMGGADLDPKTGLTSRRRSLYFRITPDDKVMFLDLFDLANPNECYQRQESVVPQQALALLNSPLAEQQANLLAQQLADASSVPQFVESAFIHILGRKPDDVERTRCERFLAEQTKLGSSRGRANLIHVLFNHNDFVTIR